jgi:hypothetical protein
MSLFVKNLQCIGHTTRFIDELFKVFLQFFHGTFVRLHLPLLRNRERFSDTWL